MANHTLAQNLTRLNKAREDIADAIVARGGTATHTDGLESMPTSIQAIPNQYAQADNGKVVSNGALISQTSTTATINGTIDTTTNDEVVVNVANSYSAGDEGKVVSNGALVAQGSDSVTENGMVDTTLISSLIVNVSGAASIAKLIPPESGVSNSDMYIVSTDSYVYIFGSVESYNTIATFGIPSSFDLDVNASSKSGCGIRVANNEQPQTAWATLYVTNRTVLLMLAGNSGLKNLVYMFEKST